MATAMKSKAEAMRASDIKLIKMGQAALGLDDDTYRAMLASLCGGKTSAKDLDWRQRQDVINHMTSSGFVIKRTHASSRAWDDSMSKLRAIWYALADVDAVQRPKTVEELDAAVEAWAKRMQPKLSALRFASGYQMQSLIEAAKKWGDRVGANIER